MKKSIKKLALKKEAISRLNALKINGGQSPTSDRIPPDLVTGTGVETCDPRDTQCICDSVNFCN